MKLQLTVLITFFTATAFSQGIQGFSSFVPKGFKVVEQIVGDLNKDGVNDCVLLIKGTATHQIITDEYRGKLDRNRRGIIVLFNKGRHYETASKNYNCFSSENEDGGVYFAPELSVDIKNGNLLATYAYGRYGYRKYIFRFRHTDFELIGYDNAEKSSFVSDGVTFDETSINLLTKKKLIKKVVNVTADGKELYKEVWKNLSVIKRLRLSEIKDFDEIEINNLLKEE